MDALASLAFGIIVIDVIRGLGIQEPKAVAKNTVKAGVFSCLLMALIYLAVTVVGAQSRGLYDICNNGGEVFALVSNHYFGKIGAMILAAMVCLACLKTAVGLVTSCAETFCKLFPKFLPYRAWAVAFSVVSFLIANLGLDTIEETPEEIILGAMVTLRQMEQSPELAAAFGNGFRESVRHIVGVQFRNFATLGGSLVSRFGFSDILTWLLSLDCTVELVGAGVLPLAEYVKMPYDRDVLVRVHITKNGRRAAYESFRNTATDLPVLTCAASVLSGELRVVIGARPARAVCLSFAFPGSDEELDAICKEVQGSIPYGSNLRGSAAYRRHLAGVLCRRAVSSLKEGTTC